MSSVPWFETPLMNAVQRDLAGWPSEKLSERSALLRLNDATAVTFSVRQKRLFMASIHSCEFVVEGPVTRPVRGNIRAHQSGWWKRQRSALSAAKAARNSPAISTVFLISSRP